MQLQQMLNMPNQNYEFDDNPELAEAAKRLGLGQEEVRAIQMQMQQQQQEEEESENDGQDEDEGQELAEMLNDVNQRGQPNEM